MHATQEVHREDDDGIHDNAVLYDTRRNGLSIVRTHKSNMIQMSSEQDSRVSKVPWSRPVYIDNGLDLTVHTSVIYASKHICILIHDSLDLLYGSSYVIQRDHVLDLAGHSKTKSRTSSHDLATLAQF